MRAALQLRSAPNPLRSPRCRLLLALQLAERSESLLVPAGPVRSGRSLRALCPCAAAATSHRWCPSIHRNVRRPHDLKHATVSFRRDKRQAPVAQASGLALWRQRALGLAATRPCSRCRCANLAQHHFVSWARIWPHDQQRPRRGHVRPISAECYTLPHGPPTQQGTPLSYIILWLLACSARPCIQRSRKALRLSTNPEFARLLRSPRRHYEPYSKSHFTTPNRSH